MGEREQPGAGGGLSSDAAVVDRDGIEALLRQIEAAVAVTSEADMAQLMDHRRLYARIEQTGNLSDWTALDRAMARSQVNGWGRLEDYWAHLKLIAVVPVEGDESCRRIYVTGWTAGKSERFEYRLHVVWDGEAWKLYDWTRLDLGLATSQEWSLYFKYSESPLLDNYIERMDLIDETHQVSVTVEEAERILKRAETLQVPPELNDYALVLTGYAWWANGLRDEAQRCLKLVRRPENVPGAWFGLMNCQEWSDQEAALQAAIRYEQVVGPVPDLLNIKASLLLRQDRKDEALDDFRRLLRYQPDHHTALLQLLLAAPEADKTQFERNVAGLEEPVQTVCELGNSIAWRDEAALHWAVDFVQRREPGSARTLNLTALQYEVAGEEEQAIAVYLQALQQAEESTERSQCVSRYLYAMANAGRLAEALRQIPDDARADAFGEMAWSWNEDELEVTPAEFEEFVLAFRELQPDNDRGLYQLALLDVQAKRYAEAEQKCRAILQHLDDATEPSVQDDDADGLKNSAVLKLAEVMARTGRGIEAFESLSGDELLFYTLASGMFAQKGWDELRQLMDLQSQRDPQNIFLPLFQGRLAEQEKRPADAERHYRLMIQRAEAADAWQAWEGRAALRELLFEQNRWREFYEEEEDKTAAWRTVSWFLRSQQRWDDLQMLAETHRRNMPGTALVPELLSEVAWERGDYAACAKLCAEALAAETEPLENWGRENVYERQFLSLMRTQQRDAARVLAEQIQRERDDATHLVAFHALTQNWDQALSLAQRMADQDAADLLYSHSEAGRLLLRPEFSPLHEKSPVTLGVMHSDSVAVVQLSRPLMLDAQQLRAALAGTNLSSAAEIQTVATATPGAEALIVRLGDAALVCVAGTGSLPSRLQVDQGDGDDQAAQLQAAIEEAAGWLYVFAAGWTDGDREPVSEAARRLAVKLAGESATAIVLPEMWQVIPADSVHVEEWQQTGTLPRTGRDSASSLSYQPDESLTATRQFDRDLHRAVRAFQANGQQPFEVEVAFVTDPDVDLLKVRVDDVSREYGTFRFQGELLNDSQLIPAVRAGLRVAVSQYNLQAWKLGDAERVERP